MIEYLCYFSLQYTITTCSNQDKSILAQNPGKRSKFPQLRLVCPWGPFDLRLLQLPASLNLTPIPFLRCFDSLGKFNFEWSKGANFAWLPFWIPLWIYQTKRSYLWLGRLRQSLQCSKRSSGQHLLNPSEIHKLRHFILYRQHSELKKNNTVEQGFQKRVEFFF